jgi:hypothetical protein
LTPERSIDLCLQTFPKLLLLLVPKVAMHSLYPECIANLKLPIDAFYRESRSGLNKGRSPSNGKLSDFSLYIDSQKSAHRKFKK